jgi:hypothetical protein
MTLRAMAVSLTAASVALADPLDALQPGEWYEVPNSQMSAVDPCPARNCSYSATDGQSAVIAAWSSGAFDTSRDRLLVWGGGHADYAGNEVYAFDLNALSWSRLTNPSDPPAPDVPYAPDGQPTSRHTYDYVQYVPSIDSMCSFGGAAFYLSGQTGTSHTDCYNFATQRWEQHPDDVILGEYIGSFSAVDPTTGHAWSHGCMGLTSLAEFDPVADAWISHGGTWTDQNNYYSYELTAAIEPIQHLLVAVGGNQSFIWDLSDAGDIAGQAITTTGDTSMVEAGSPGFVHDSASGLFVAWNGGTDVYTLDPSTWAWTHVPPAASNTVTPTAAAATGTFGRFRYSPAHNVFVAVNAVDEDVFVYRLTNDAGVPPPSVQLVAAPAVIDAGGTSTLTWSTVNASGCTASGAWTGPQPTGGSQEVGPLFATSTFHLTCTGAAGVGGSLVTVEVLGGTDGGGVDAGAPDAGAGVDAGGPSADGGEPGRAAGGCGCGSGSAPDPWLSASLAFLFLGARSLRRRCRD